MTTKQVLSDFNNYNVNNLVFSKPVENNIPNSLIKYKRINISTRLDDGTFSDLIFASPTLFSFGVQESKDMVTGMINGYVMPLRLWSRTGPTEDEKKFVDAFNTICDHIKHYLVDHQNSFGRNDLELRDLKKFNPIYWKKDKLTGKIDEAYGPMLYAKMITSKREDKTFHFKTRIFDINDPELEHNPLDILNKHCSIIAAIKIESIFIGSGGDRISLQVKIWEAEIAMQDNTPSRLLPVRPPPLEIPKSTSPYQDPIRTSEEHDDDDEFVPRRKSFSRRV